MSGDSARRRGASVADAVGSGRYATHLGGFCGAGPASLELATPAFVDVRVGPLVAHIAVPDNDGGIRFDDLEVVLAVGGGGHCDMWRIDYVTRLDKKARLDAC